MPHIVYSGIFDSGHSEIRTPSLQRTQVEAPKYFLPIVPIHVESPKEDSLFVRTKRLPQSHLHSEIPCTKSILSSNIHNMFTPAIIDLQLCSSVFCRP